MTCDRSEVMGRAIDSALPESMGQMGLPEYMESMRWLNDYFELVGIEKTWLPYWRGWHFGWTRLIGLGEDESYRRILLIGPVCIPLWRCRCKVCRAYVADLRKRIRGVAR